MIDHYCLRPSASDTHKVTYRVSVTYFISLLDTSAYTLFVNIGAVVIVALMLYLRRLNRKHDRHAHHDHDHSHDNEHEHHQNDHKSEWSLQTLATTLFIAILIGGLIALAIYHG